MPNGSHYIGELNVDGQPHGQGASFHPDGSPFVTLLVDAADVGKSGRWVNGGLHGPATKLHPNGDRYEGLFKDDRFEGLGMYCWKDGARFEGELVANFRGLGARWDKEGKLDRCGRWEDTKLVESRAVPLRLLPEGKYLSAAGQSAATAARVSCIALICSVRC